MLGMMLLWYKHRLDTPYRSETADKVSMIDMVIGDMLREVTLGAIETAIADLTEVLLLLTIKVFIRINIVVMDGRFDESLLHLIRLMLLLLFINVRIAPSPITYFPIERGFRIFRHV